MNPASMSELGPIVSKRAFAKRRPYELASHPLESSEPWRKFKIAIIGKAAGAVNSLKFTKRSWDFSTGQPNMLFVGGGTKVELCRLKVDGHRLNMPETKAYSRFKYYVNDVALRRDERLACACDDSGCLQVFEVATRAEIRRMNAHKGPARACAFFFNQLMYCVTGGDDRSLRIWDISESQCFHEIEAAHLDRITCIATSPSPSQSSTELVFASGGADKTVKLWSFDLPTKTVVKTTCLAHDHDVTSIQFFSDGNLIACCGGSMLKIWDVSGEPKLLHAIVSHTKAVTSVCVAHDGGYICSGSLDQTVKIHSTSTGQILHTLLCDDVVTSLDACLTQDGLELIAIGLVDGQYILRQSVLGGRTLKKPKTQSEAPDPEESSSNRVKIPIPQKSLNYLDRLLQGFQHQKALDFAMKQSDLTSLALIDHLMNQSALQIAVRGKNDQSILPCLSFVSSRLGYRTSYIPLLCTFYFILTSENSWLTLSKNPKIIQALRQLSQKLDQLVAQHQMSSELFGLTESCLSRHL